jgi:hypothetical protein
MIRLRFCATYDRARASRTARRHHVEGRMQSLWTIDCSSITYSDPSSIVSSEQAISASMPWSKTYTEDATGLGESSTSPRRTTVARRFRAALAAASPAGGRLPH